jgi:hypothetical protein
MADGGGAELVVVGDRGAAGLLLLSLCPALGGELLLGAPAGGLAPGLALRACAVGRSGGVGLRRPSRAPCGP